MKVMWMGNIILPAIAEKESLPPVYIVGWLVGLSRRLTQLPDVALTYVFDAPKALTGEVDGYRYYGLVNPHTPYAAVRRSLHPAAGGYSAQRAAGCHSPLGHGKSAHAGHG